MGKSEDAAYKFLFVATLVVAGFIWRPFILMDGWQWFVVPAFGVAPLTWTSGFWVSVCFGFLFGPLGREIDKDRSAQVVAWLVRYPIAHAVLWLVAN